MPYYGSRRQRRSSTYNRRSTRSYTKFRRANAAKRIQKARRRYVNRRRNYALARRSTYRRRVSIPRGPIDHTKLVKLRYAAHFSLNCGPTNSYWSTVRFRCDDTFDPDVSLGGHQPQGRDAMFTMYDKSVIVSSVCKMTASPHRNEVPLNTSGSVDTPWPSAHWGICMHPENGDDLSRGFDDIVKRNNVPLTPHSIWENGDEKAINLSFSRAKLPQAHTNSTKLPTLTARYNARKYWGIAKGTRLRDVDGLIDEGPENGSHTPYEESDDLSKYKYNPSYTLWAASTDQDTGDLTFTVMLEYTCLFFGRIQPLQD